MVTAQDIASLRKKTGVGLMACKKALIEANGNEEEAIKLLRERGISKAGGKADRETKEGGIGIVGRAMIMIACETDFVARNENFVAMCQEIAEKLNNEGEDAMKAHWEDVKPAKMQEMGENLVLSESVLVSEGEVLGGYIHSNRKIGVIVAGTGMSEEQAKDVAMHAAAMDPLVANPEDVPAEVIESEKEIYREQMQNEGKPAEIIDKIIAGKVNKFKAERALTSQSFVKDPSQTVQQYLGDGKVVRFVRFAV